MVVAIAMFEGETAGALYGVLGGLLWDCASGTAFGFNALFLMFIGITVGLLVNYLFRNTLFSVFLFTAVFSVIIELITWFFFYYMVRDTNIIFVFLMIILPAVLYTLLFTAPLYYGVKQIKKKLTFE
jgi:rod shape-determining protein MreD